jgi:Domain of unknown function (DUF929)
MSKQPNRRGAQKRRPQQRKGRTAMAAKGGRSNRMTWILVGGVVVVGIALIAAFASSDKNSGASDYVKGEEPAPTALVSKVTGVSDDVINEVGPGSITSVPKKLPGPTLETGDGKPRVIYIGSDFCPYCATERWAMVNALSRFGTFEGLKITNSAKNTREGSPEVYPGTGTFSFNGATYTSDYLAFEPTEQVSNTYETLGTPTAEQQALFERYNSDGGGIPFIDFANEYMISGASYKPEVLQGKTREEIAAELSNASSDVTQGVVGTANVMTATICTLTDNQPANVCKNATIQTIQSQLPS